MKRYLASIFTGLVLVTAVLLSACSNPFKPSSELPADSAGTGRVTISFGAGAARSIEPDLNFDNYKFVFTKYDEYGENLGDTTRWGNGGKSFTFDLSPGIYTLTVTAYKGEVNEDNKAAIGTSDAPFEVKASGNATVRIKMAGTATEGRGTFAYNIIYPDNAFIVEFSLSGPEEVILTDQVASGVPGEIDLDAGYYIMGFRLRNDAGGATGIMPVVDIYKNTITRFDQIFEDSNFSPSYAPVTGLTGVPTEATVGTGLPLTGTVAPFYATNQAITWSVADAGTTGAIITGDTLSTTAAGTVTVTATITNGKTAATDYTQDFLIIVTSTVPPYVPVTNIILPSDDDGDGEITISAEVGIPLVTASIYPSDADAVLAGKTIVWSAVDVVGIDEVMEQGVTQNNPSMRASNEGTYTLRATVEDGIAAGTPFVKDFYITVTPITDVDTWQGLYIWPLASTTTIGDFYGKEDVLRLAPNAQGIYDWAPLRYDITEYADANRQITVEVSLSYYIDSADNGAKVRFQAISKNGTGYSYPEITSPGSATGSWQQVTGSPITFVPGYTVETPYHGYVYIDESGVNGLNKKTVYLADLTLKINGVIVNRPIIAVDSVSLNKTSLELTVGDTETLTPTVLPVNADYNAVTWKSSDDSVATVSEGVVTAVGAGNAIITVTAADGSKTAEANVTVNSIVPPDGTGTVVIQWTNPLDDKLITKTVVKGTSVVLESPDVPGAASYTWYVGSVLNPAVGSGQEFTFDTSDKVVGRAYDIILVVEKAGTPFSKPFEVIVKAAE
jgi:uncharacterized protein YjdB